MLESADERMNYLNGRQTVSSLLMESLKLKASATENTTPVQDEELAGTPQFLEISE